MHVATGVAFLEFLVLRTSWFGFVGVVLPARTRCDVDDQRLVAHRDACGFD